MFKTTQLTTEETATVLSDFSDFRTLAIHFFDDFSEMKKHGVSSDTQQLEVLSRTKEEAHLVDEFNALKDKGEKLEERVVTILNAAEKECSNNSSFNEVAAKTNTHPEDYAAHAIYGQEVSRIAEKIVGFNKQWRELETKKTAYISSGVDKIRKSLRHFKTK